MRNVNWRLLAPGDVAAETLYGTIATALTAPNYVYV